VYLHILLILASLSCSKGWLAASPAASQALRLYRTAFLHNPHVLYSSFASDASEYTNDAVEEDEEASLKEFGSAYRESDDSSQTIELGPVATSKNSANRFVMVVWDKDIVTDKDPWDLHHDRVDGTEDHVMYCRKANLYNETVNTESQVDVVWSLPM
jgi:hypothetical protein